LRFNQITKIDALRTLKNLLRLYLSTNKVSELEPINELYSLTHLYLASNQISDICAIKNLLFLTELDLRNNKINQIDALGNLLKLTGLFLENNQISDISALINLTELRQLNLRNNQIIQIDALKKLKKINQLYLSNNKIQLLPKWIVDFDLKIKWNSGGDGISVIANPLKYPPPEIIRQGNLAIKAYFEDLEQQQQRPINEVKVCFVGDSGVGKSSLVRLLCNEVFNQQQLPTQGIEIKDWQYQKMTFHCWDFSGDNTIQATHSLFFSDHCLYILVLDNRTQRREDYWLKKIEYLAGNVPILIVLNKCEESISYDVNRRKLVKSYNSLQSNHFFSISCIQGLGLDEFKQGLMSAIKQIPALKKQWSENWIQVKKTLEQQLKQQYYISSEKYSEICLDQGIKDSEQQQQLLQSLHDLGTIVYFNKINFLENTILASHWIIKSLYKLICFAQIRENNGLFFLKDLGVVFKKNSSDDYDYSVDNYRYLINLVRDLELCYLIDKSSILVPQLLSETEPNYEFLDENLLRFKIHYEYLNEAIISRFIVMLQEDIVDNKYWRTGVVLSNKIFNASALVKGNYSENLITISS
jgi:Leucine-rich repeat (LRR) protein